MFIRTKDKPNDKTAVQIVEPHFSGKKISQKIYRHIGQAPNEKELNELKRLAQAIIDDFKEQRKPSLPLLKPENMSDYKALKPVEDTVKLNNLREEQRVINGIGDVFGKLYDDIGFNRLRRIRCGGWVLAKTASLRRLR